VQPDHDGSLPVIESLGPNVDTQAVFVLKAIVPLIDERELIQAPYRPRFLWTDIAISQGASNAFPGGGFYGRHETAFPARGGGVGDASEGIHTAMHEAAHLSRCRLGHGN